ncbi:glucose-6-phosphate isomerase family protein [Enterobacter asburiae]|uniref:glucose-6-phosphate isomerase family protein n=1 Tax=Scandinavium sp. UTDF21-P1B TaxID=3446379 RepID=UPI00346C85B7
MKPIHNPPRHVDWATGALHGEPLIRKTTHLGDLAGVFADDEAWRQSDPLLPVYTVEMFDSPSGAGELYTGVTHLNPGRVGDELFMTRGHFHARREQGEVYFGLCGEGFLLLQDEQGKTRLEKVTAGSVHIIAGFTAHRLVNSGSEILSALAVWPTTAGHDYASLAGGFARSITTANLQRMAKEVQNG